MANRKIFLLAVALMALLALCHATELGSSKRSLLRRRRGPFEDKLKAREDHPKGRHLLKACGSDADCSAGKWCAAGVCTNAKAEDKPRIPADNNPTGRRHLLKACGSDADCSAGKWCAAGVCTNGKAEDKPRIPADNNPTGHH